MGSRDRGCLALFFGCCDAKNVWEESGMRLLIDTKLAGGDAAATIVFNLLCKVQNHTSKSLLRCVGVYGKEGTIRCERILQNQIRFQYCTH